MGSPKGTKKGRWPWLLKCIIWLYQTRGYKGEALLEKFHKHVSREVLNEILGYEASDNAVLQRAHKGIFGKNVSEHPDKHPRGEQYMAQARWIISRGTRLTTDEIRGLESAILGQSSLL